MKSPGYSRIQLKTKTVAQNSKRNLHQLSQFRVQTLKVKLCHGQIHCLSQEIINKH